MDKTVLIDGNSLLNRAYFATPELTTSGGTPTNAIFGFLKLFEKIMKEVQPRYVAVAFDLRAPTFRHRMYAGYKATRKPMQEALAAQVPILKECLGLMNVRICELEGYEADDLLGTMSKKFDSLNLIYTGDRDSYQLVDEKTQVCFTRKGVSDILTLTRENFEEVVGLRPEQIVDLKALMGDASDNIPGVPGIGEKTARQLLADYGSLEGVYASVGETKGALRRKLEEGRDSAFLSYRLATIDRDVPIETELSDCEFRFPFSAAVRRKFISLELRQFYEKDELFEAAECAPGKAPVGGDAAPAARSDFRELAEIEGFLAAHREFSCVWGEEKCIAAGDEERRFAGMDIPLASDGAETPVLRALFGNPANTVTVYDAKETMHMLAERGIGFSAAFEDVSLLRYAAEAGTARDDRLRFVLESYGLPAETPARSLARLYAALREKAGGNGTLAVYEDIEKPLVRVLFGMEQAGVRIDTDCLDTLGREYRERAEAVSRRVHELAGDDAFNINSSAQLGEILFGKLGLPGGKKTKRGVYSSNADVLEKLAPDHEIVREVLEYRKLQKLNSTYVEGMRPYIREGRVHTTFTQSVTATGRLSSKNPNLQNIPVRTEEGRELRKLFLADEGHVLLDADYSQIELRVLAHFSGCPELIEAYRAGKDIHRETAAKIYGVPEDLVTPEMRRTAKTVNFGIIYGESDYGLSQEINISRAAAREFIRKYFEAYPAIREYQERTVAEAKALGYVTTLSGRRRNLPELSDTDRNKRQFGERAAMNTPLQGTSADIIKAAMIAVQRELEKKRMASRLILQIHDELIIDAPEEEADEAAELLRECMEGAAELRVPLIAEVKRGRTWYEAK